MKCELCGSNTDKLYKVPFADDYDIDEDGKVYAQYVPYNVCSACVPEEMVDVLDGQQVMQNLLTSKWR